MTTYEFTCRDCGAQIEVTDAFREAALVEGCPVCAAAVTGDDFTELEGQ